MIDTEDKQAWCRRAEGVERLFVQRYGADLGVAIHPDKARNRFGPDLLVLGHRPGDLKEQSTKYRNAGRYGVFPSRAVTFNRKDLERYLEKYPDIFVFFWVRFLPGEPVYLMDMDEARRLCVASRLHYYDRRGNDENAKCSYVLDINDMERLL